MKMVILGAGAYGVALGGVLTENGYEVVYYDPIKTYENLDICADLEEALRGVEAMVLCVPSEVAPELLVQLPKDKFLIVATKGFLTEQSFAEFKDWAVLSGGGFAEDIENQKHTVLTATDERLVEMFTTDYLEIELIDDCKGVLMCGALKNIYAIGAGLEDLKPETEALRQYLDNATMEMRRILKANGADLATVDLSCGVGDLKTTCGPRSRNYNYGLELRNNPAVKPEGTLEGLAALKRIRAGDIVVPKEALCLRKLMEESEK